MALTTEQSTYMTQLDAACTDFLAAVEAAMLADNAGSGTLSDGRTLAVDSVNAFKALALRLGYPSAPPNPLTYVDGGGNQTVYGAGGIPVVAGAVPKLSL